MRSVIVLGGGATGWMAAAYLSRFVPGLELTVIEAPDLPPLIVGESTNSITRRFNLAVGLDEASFLRAVDGTFKIAITFEGFSARGEIFHHPFGRPARDVRFTPGAQDQYPTTHDCRAARFDPEARVHGYHVDAGKYSAALRELAMSRGVTRLVRRIDDVEAAPGRIVSMDGLTADLYVDCTGFRARLLGEALGEPFESIAHVLLNDAAVAMRVPYRDRDRELAPATRCTALEAGWVWRIPLWSRLGVGYCYSSRFLDPPAAERALRAHLGEDRVAGIEAVHLRIRHGRHRRPWVGNCVALGLAAGFIEPLESTGISLTQRNIMDLAVRLDDPEGFGRAANRRFDTTVDFIQAHYALTRREDTPYWRAVRALPHTDGLARVLAGAAARSYAPIEEDRGAFYRPANWNLILSGMGFFDGAPAPPPACAAQGAATARAHHAYLRDHIHRAGPP